MPSCAFIGPPVLWTPSDFTTFGADPPPFQPFIGHCWILFPIWVCAGISKEGLISWFPETPSQVETTLSGEFSCHAIESSAPEPEIISISPSPSTSATKIVFACSSM